MSRHNRLLKDIPIENDSEDLFGYKKFADRLTDSIKEFSPEEGIVIALNGEWGSGKTSIINIVKNQLGNAGIKVISYSYCWYEGRNEVITAFLFALSEAVGQLSDSKDAVRKILQFIKPLTTAANLVTQSEIPEDCRKLALQFFSPKSMEEHLSSIKNFLRSQKQQLVIFIDDLDRMDPDDSIEVYKLLKTVGRLPNVTFVVVYDKLLTQEILRDRYPSEGQNFLEKIIQISFDIPVPSSEELFDVFISELNKTFPDNDFVDELEQRWHQYIYEFIKTPRNLGRLLANVEFNARPIIREIYLQDYILLEILRLHFPEIYQEVARNKRVVCQDETFEIVDSGRPEVNESFISHLLSLEQCYQSSLKRLLEDLLFPAISSEKRKSEKRLCSSDHFCTYFNLKIDSATVSKYELEQFIEASKSAETLRNKLAIYLNEDAEIKRSWVVLKELVLHPESIANKETAEQIMLNWVQVIDELYDTKEVRRVDQDKDIYQLLHRLWGKIRTKFFASSADANTFISKMLAACSIHWTLQLINEQNDRYSRLNERKEELELLKDDFRRKIQTLVGDQKLLNLGNRLPSCLLNWRSAFGYDRFLSVTLDQYLESDEKVDLIARAFIVITRSSSGELSDYARTNEAESFMNVQKFYASVKRASRNGYKNALRFWRACNQYDAERKIRGQP